MIASLVVTTLRFQRLHILVTVGFLLLLTAVLIAHGQASASLLTELRLGAACPRGGCDELPALVEHRFQTIGRFLPVLGLLPAAIGAFWGAPLLSRQFETGTIKLVWTQSVSRRSWILTTMLVLGTLAAIGGAVVGRVTDTWLEVFRGLDLPGTTASDPSFGEIRGVAPAGWWIFGFTLGCFAGAVLRKTIPAMAFTVTVVVFAFVGSNLLPALGPEAFQTSSALLFHVLEPVSLMAASLLLATATCWSVERASV